VIVGRRGSINNRDPADRPGGIGHDPHKKRRARSPNAILKAGRS
jgi:hypothetical protein